MNPSRDDQEKTSEAKDAATSRAQAFDKWLCWNPGHNAREREIVAHMTPDERAAFQRISALAGAALGLTMAGAVGILMLAESYTEFGAVGLVACLIANLPIACFMFIGVRRSAQKFMMNTAWAREQGWE